MSQTNQIAAANRQRDELALEMDLANDAAFRAGVPANRLQTSEWYQGRKAMIRMIDRYIAALSEVDAGFDEMLAL